MEKNLPSMCEALSLISITHIKKKKKKAFMNKISEHENKHINTRLFCFF